MQRRLNSEWLGDAEICADRNLMRIIHENEELEHSNSTSLARAKEAVRDVLANEISARQKEFIMLYYYKQMNICEIAEMFGVNKSTVSRTLSRARRNILTKLKYIL